MEKLNNYQQEDSVCIWNNIAKNYDFNKYWEDISTHAWQQVLLSHIGSPVGKSILEVGCGSAFQSLALSQKGAIISLIDISENVIQKAREVLSR